MSSKGTPLRLPLVSTNSRICDEIDAIDAQSVAMSRPTGRHTFMARPSISAGKSCLPLVAAAAELSFLNSTRTPQRRFLPAELVTKFSLK